MKNKKFAIDYNDPMNGIIKYLRTNNKLNYISTTDNSYDDNNPASNLLQQETSSYFESRNQIGAYFEIHFNVSAVLLTGYGFMALKSSVAPPRNWNVSCMSTNPPTLLANEVENNLLCPEGSSSTYVSCSSNKKISYEVSKKNIYCTDIRFTTTKRNAYMCCDWLEPYYYFELTGVELFGSYVDYLSNMKCTCFCRNVFRTRCVFIYCFVHSQ